MKTLLILLFSFFSLCSYGQSIIIPTFSGNDLGFGVRYDHQVSHNREINHGFYVHAGYGCYRDVYIGKIEHYRASGGYEIILPTKSGYMNIIFSTGINGHYYNHFEEGWTKWTTGSFPVSWEYGMGFIYNKRLVWTINHTPFKKDIIVGLGYRFGLYKTR
jgi:hypothetical protein